MRPKRTPHSLGRFPLPIGQERSNDFMSRRGIRQIGHNERLLFTSKTVFPAGVVRDESIALSTDGAEAVIVRSSKRKRSASSWRRTNQSPTLLVTSG